MLPTHPPADVVGGGCCVQCAYRFMMAACICPSGASAMLRGFITYAPKPTLSLKSANFLRGSVARGSLGGDTPPSPCSSSCRAAAGAPVGRSLRVHPQARTARSPVACNVQEWRKRAGAQDAAVQALVDAELCGCVQREHEAEIVDVLLHLHTPPGQRGAGQPTSRPGDDMVR